MSFSYKLFKNLQKPFMSQLEIAAVSFAYLGQWLEKAFSESSSEINILQTSKSLKSALRSIGVKTYLRQWLERAVSKAQWQYILCRPVKLNV